MYSVLLHNHHQNVIKMCLNAMFPALLITKTLPDGLSAIHSYEFLFFPGASW